jgi:histidine phosphotransfer protein HptB
MNNLRILLVDSDEFRADNLISRLTSAGYSAVSVPGIAEAREAFLIQNFDAIVFGIDQLAEPVANFALELNQREAGKASDHRTAIFSCSPDLASPSSPISYLPAVFTAAQFAEAAARFDASSPPDTDSSGLDVFIPEGFEEQCASDPELMIEIIDLFSEERDREFVQMRVLLGEQDFEHLARVAHTMKGSLGTLHAPQARFRTQELESAAKDRDAARCAHTLDLLDQDLALLQGELAAFRLGLSR